MLQRNTSGYPLRFPTLVDQRQLEPGEEIEHPTRLAGCTPVDEIETSSTSKRTSRTSKTDAAGDGEATNKESDR